MPLFRDALKKLRQGFLFRGSSVAVRNSAFFFRGSSVAVCDSAFFFAEALSRFAIVLFFSRKHYHVFFNCVLLS